MSILSGSKRLLFFLGVFFFVQLVLLRPSYATFDDCAIDWNLFTSAPGFITDYTYKGQPIRDVETSSDPSHGPAAVPPAETDLASGVGTGSSNPGPDTTPAFGYYNGGTPYDPNNPSTMQNDYILFRMRIEGNPSTNKTDFTAYHWNVLLDVDRDGYKEYWVDLEGACTQQVCSFGYDRLNILYDDLNRQSIPDPDAAGVRVEYYRAYNTATASETGDTACPAGSPGRSHTRVIAANDGTGDYFIEEQIPMTAFKDSYGNQVLYPNSPVAFVFSTSASNTNPLQKDWMMDLNYLSDADPITFGDIIYPNGQPVVEFTDSSMNFVSAYSILSNVYVYVRDPLANTNDSTVQTIQVTVSDPATGDDQVITLQETGPATGIFSSIGVTTLPTVNSNGTPNDSDGIGGLEVVAGDTIYVTYTNISSQTVTDQAVILDTCSSFIQFTRANGLPSDHFILTTDPNTSDELYVTVIRSGANTNPAVVDTIQVTLTGSDTQVLTLTETGVNTGVFRNTAGLQTKISDGTITPNDNLWEDIDGGVVTATYNYTCGSQQYNKTASASLFTTLAGGRVYFTNQTGTLDVNLYGPGQPDYIKVVDPNYTNTCNGGLNTVTVKSPTGDSEVLTIVETFPGSGVFTNMTPLVTEAYTGSFVVNNGILSINDGQTLTVEYRDCNDGDSDASNDIKKDTAVFNAPSIVINEVLFWPTSDPVNPDSCAQTEYVQLYNSTSQAVNITDYVVTDNDAFTYPIRFNGSSSPLMLGAGKTVYVSIYPSGSLPPDTYDSSTGNYYLFAPAVNPDSYPSNEFGDPGYASSADRADQIVLKNSTGTVIDYVGWSSTVSPSVDYVSDTAGAVQRGIWQDGAFVNVSGLTVGHAITRSVTGFDTNVPGDWTIAAATSGVCETISAITYAVVSSFDAFVEGGMVVVRWETSYERNTLGFYLLRLDGVTGKYESVTSGLMPGAFTSPKGGIYTLIDRTALPGAVYQYKLVEVERDGVENTYGPYAVSPGAALKAGLERATSRASLADSHVASRTAAASPSDFSRKGRERTASENARIALAKKTDAEAQSVQSGPGNRIRIPVVRDGMYFVSADDIGLLLGMSPAQASDMIRRNQLSLSSQGVEVAYLPDDKGAGLYFYGRGTDSVYARENVYWIDSATGVQMSVVKGKPKLTSGDPGVFTETKHIEEDLIPNMPQFSDPDADYWEWSLLFLSDFYSDPPQVFDGIGADGLADTGASASLAVHLLGGSESDHHVAVNINGHQLAQEGLWSGLDPYTLTLVFPQSFLQTAGNSIEVQGVLDSGVDYSLIFIDSLDLTYKRTYEAVGDKLFFRGDGNKTVTAGGFTGPDIFLFDITNPRTPKLNTAASISASAGSYAISFNPESAASRYLAVERAAVMNDLPLQAVVPTSLKSSSNAADYVIIAPAVLAEDAQVLADYRAGKGLRTIVVKVEDIMNEFNYGISSPGAIRDFLSFAYRNWQEAPRYVVLAGDGTWDYRDNWGLGGNLVPPAMVAVPTADGLVASDNYLADVNGDGVPQMAVGRLPVVTHEELLGLIDKIQAYELGAAGRPLVALLVADNSDGAVDFAWDSEGIAALFPSSYTLEKLYLDSHPADAKPLLLSYLNGGSVFFNYVGHGARDLLSNSILLTNTTLYDPYVSPPPVHVDSLQNGDGLPVVTALTCAMGEFAVPGELGLSESMLLKPDGGAAAVWSATGLSDNAEAVLLNREFFSVAFGSGKRTLGDAVLEALKTYRLKGGVSFMAGMYGIIGDPGLEMP